MAIPTTIRLPARTADTTTPSTTETTPAASPSAPTTGTASAPAGATSDPQHPPCDEPTHQRGKGCGWTHCGICSEEYDLGQKISRPAGFHYWPEGEHAYWTHCRTSERHQLVGRIADIQMARVLAKLETVLPAAKTYQKLMRREDLAPLRRLFR